MYNVQYFQIKEISQAGRDRKNTKSPDTLKIREPRFVDFLWLYTSSITETATSFSKTFTMTIAGCTPAAGVAGLIPSACAAAG